MADLEINGHTVTVDDSFLSLSPDDQNRTVDEISKSLPPAANASWSDVGNDIANTALPKAEEGLMARSTGAPGDIARLGEYLAGKFNSYFPEHMAAADRNYAKMHPGEAPPPALSDLLPSSDDMKRRVEDNITGPLPQPQTRMGRIVGEGIAAAANPLSYVGPGGPVSKAFTAFGSGAGGEAGGQAAEGTNLELPARIVGSVVGGGVPNKVAGLLTPNPITADQAAANAALQNAGVTDLRAGRLTGSPSLQRLEEESSSAFGGGQRAHEMDQSAKSQMTRAVLSDAGIDADRAHPEVIDNRFRQLGNEFDRIANGNRMTFDPQVQNDLLNHVTNYQDLVAPAFRSTLPESVMNDASNLARANGSLTGQQYQNLVSRLGNAAREASDPATARTLMQMRESLDDAFERTLQQTNPQDAGALANARQQYRALLTIEKAAPKDASGILAPIAVTNAMQQIYGPRNFARGNTPMNAVARAARGNLANLPNSNTAARESIRNFGHNMELASLLGNEEGQSLGRMLGTGMIAQGVNAGIGRTVMSRPVQWWLANQLVPGRTNSSPALQAIPGLLSHYENDNRHRPQAVLPQPGLLNQAP